MIIRQLYLSGFRLIKYGLLCGLLLELLRYCSTYYLPFLQANSQAISNGQSTLMLQLADRRFEQPVFKYQAKCFERLKALLAERHEQHLLDLLAETGCLLYLE